MKSKLNALVVILASIGVGTIAIAQGRHDEKPHGVVNADSAPALSVTPRDSTEQAIALKDGGTLILRKDGTMYHADAAGKRVQMKDGVVMEANDGTWYMMKSDAVWKQISEKGTMHPNHQ
jgi:hypothetical protein